MKHQLTIRVNESIYSYLKSFQADSNQFSLSLNQVCVYILTQATKGRDFSNPTLESSLFEVVL